MVSLGKFSVVVVATGLVAGLSWAQETPKSGASCPVVQAAHFPGLGASVPIGKNGSVDRNAPRKDGQHLDLKLMNSSMSPITSIRITVRGWRSGTGATLPAQKTELEHESASKTLNVTVNIASRKTVSHDVWVSGLASVDSVDVDEVKYADGLVWRPSSLGACRVVPDPLMLISKDTPSKP